MRTLTFQRASALCLTTSIEFFHLASVPSAEDCTQAGADDELQTMECAAYINLLRRTLGNEPAGCEFFIIENNHEFGTYFEAGIFYPIPEDEDNQEQSAGLNYALQCEQGPEYWDQQAKRELIQSGYFKYVGAKIIQMRKTA